MVSVVNALESIKGRHTMLKIEVSRSYPHQSLDFCVDSIAMLRDLLGAARPMN
ncbi:hypothetical protein [Komagataeibacter kakiaceti]|uniref:hypothetical protein n=1 Tax=Komagataeibacter kakiaceti TaxID=943261 RepID=UPI00131F1401|nr:hypothetical protein [Komagataeibacter kakiaceti]